MYAKCECSIILDWEKISRADSQDIFSNLARHGSLPIIINYNLSNHLETYSTRSSKKIMQKWMDSESIDRPYTDKH